MTEPTRYPRSVGGLFMRFVMFCLIAGGITWWIVPHNVIDSIKTAATSQPARQSTGPVASTSAKSSHAAIKPSPRPAYVRKEDDVDGGHWVVSAEGAFMHTNASGSSLQLSLNSNSLPPDMIPLLKARSNAIHAGTDPALNITDDQRKRLRTVRINFNSASTKEEREHMRQAWAEYQKTLVDPTLTADAKGAADSKLTQTLAQTADAAHEAVRQRVAAAGEQIRNILSADQIKALSQPRTGAKS